MNATEESQQEEIEMDLISKLYDFVENGGRLEAGKEPCLRRTVLSGVYVSACKVNV